MSEDLRYPIGNFDKNIELTFEIRQQLIETIAELPKKIKSATSNLSDEELDTPYRPEGWTVRQTSEI